MSKKAEIYQDIVDNCDIVLDLLKEFIAENESPEGRMIHQCHWLKEQVGANTLPLPTEDYVYTLKYIEAENLLEHLASTEVKYDEEIGIYLYRLCYLVEDKLLLKPQYYPFAIRSINELRNLLLNSSRTLDQYEQGLIEELDHLLTLFKEDDIEPPLMTYMPNYPNFIEVEGIKRITIDDLPNGELLYRLVAALIFEGIRPDTWLTPEDADRETQNMISDFPMANEV